MTKYKINFMKNAAFTVNFSFSRCFNQFFKCNFLGFDDQTLIYFKVPFQQNSEPDKKNAEIKAFLFNLS